LVLRCMSNGWCGYQDENGSVGRFSSRFVFALVAVVSSITCILS
jgi:hypothetical protein